MSRKEFLPKDTGVLFLAATNLMGGALASGGKFPIDGSMDAEYQEFMHRQEVHFNNVMAMVVKCYRETYLPLIREREVLQSKE